jgi:serine/threonine-protein phosphatase 6 regulatory subunit 3
MAIVNRSSEFDHLYDSMGRLQGGLSVLEELAQVISIGNSGNRDADTMDDREDSIEPAKELPVSTGRPMLSLDSDEDMIVEEPGSSDDEAMEEISMSPPPANALLPQESSSPVQTTAITTPRSASPAPGSPTYTASQRRESTESFGSGTMHRMSKSSRQNSRKTLSSSTKISLPLGERLKQRFLELNVLSTLLVSHTLHLSTLGFAHHFDRIYFSSFRGIISSIAWFTT